EIKLTTNIEDIFNDNSIDCIVEVMGGVEYPYEIIKRALTNNVNVVSANKDLIALHGKELLELAKNNDCSLFFEAAVAGGIPILRTITKSLANDEIFDIKGILNGTSNYILTKMTQENLSYEAALKQAQELGFAEADPTADVEGIDAARKVAILAMLAFNVNTTLKDVKVEGISNVKDNDIKIASDLSYTIKLIGHTFKNDSSISLYVTPSFVNNNNPLAQVDNELNSVYLEGKYINKLNLVGPGAGSLPTGIAVVSDIIEVAYQKQGNLNGKDIVIPNSTFKINNESLEEYIIFGDEKEVLTLTNQYKIIKNTAYYTNSLDSNKVKDLKEKTNLSIYKIIN
ncbi:MAG: homoserine dehydrogenase, partial [Erysipelotrichales bacterium]